MQRSIHNGTYSCGISDLCNAFDTVDHKILLTKLEYYGIQGVANDWFASYLSNRRQFVSLFGTDSDYQTVILEFHLFAGDTNLFLNNPNILNLETK